MQAFETIRIIDTKGQLKLVNVEDIEQETNWANELSPQQRLEFQVALQECENPAKLTAHEEVVKMSRQWLQE